MLGEVWLPRVGAAVCAAHYLEHQLREPQGVMLLAELQDAAAAAAAVAAAGGGADAASEPAGASSEAGAAAAGPPVGGKDTAAAVAAGSTGQSQAGPKGRTLVSLLDREAAAFGSLRKQWAYKLAKQAVDRFHQLFTPYK